MIYCLGCGYCLEGLSEDRCPECGRSFEPNGPGTFALEPTLGLWRRPGVGLLVFSLLGLGLLVIGRERPMGGLPLITLGLMVETCVLIAAVSALITSKWYRCSPYPWVAIVISAVLVVPLALFLLYVFFFGFAFMPFL